MKLIEQIKELQIKHLLDIQELLQKNVTEPKGITTPTADKEKILLLLQKAKKEVLKDITDTRKLAGIIEYANYLEQEIKNKEF